MKTLDEVIEGFECCENIDCGNCPYKILFNDDSHVPCDQFSKDEDALYYLKEYRENKSGLEKTKEALEVKKKIYENMTEKIMQQGQENEARCQAEITRYQEAVKNCEEAENKYKQKQKAAEDVLWKISSEMNPALTWDELKQMEGKPVWVEHKHYNKWLIVYEVYENTIVLDGNGFYTQYFSDDNDKEVRWQAYRKER